MTRKKVKKTNAELRVMTSEIVNSYSVLVAPEDDDGLTKIYYLHYPELFLKVKDLDRGFVNLRKKLLEKIFNLLKEGKPIRRAGARNLQVNVRFTASEMMILKTVAAAQDMTVTEYVRKSTGICK